MPVWFSALVKKSTLRFQNGIIFQFWAFGKISTLSQNIDHLKAQFAIGPSEVQFQNVELLSMLPLNILYIVPILPFDFFFNPDFTLISNKKI